MYTNIVTGSPVGILTNYTIFVTVSFVADMQSDFSDVYFTSTDNIELVAWPHTVNNGVEAKFWVKIPSIPASPGTVAFYTKWNDGHSPTRSRNTLLVVDDVEQGGNMTLLTPYSGNPVLHPNDAGSWTAQHMYFDSIIYHDNKYIMYWNGRPSESQQTLNAIGAATSLDGYNFSCSGINSGTNLGKIFAGTGVGGDWDSQLVSFARFFVDTDGDGLVHMFYIGSNGVTGGIGHATSVDGLTNWQREATPIMNADNNKRPGGVVKFKGTYFFYYLDGASGYPCYVATASSINGSWTVYSDNPVVSPINPLYDYGIAIAHPFVWNDKIYLSHGMGWNLPATNKFGISLSESSDGFNFTGLGYPEQSRFWGYDPNNVWENYYITPRNIPIRINGDPTEKILFYWNGDTNSDGKDSIGVAESTYSEMPWLPAGKAGTERITKWVDESSSPITGNHSLKCLGVGTNRDYVIIDVGESNVEVTAKVKSLAALSEQGICLRLTPTANSDNGTGYGLWADRATGNFALKKMADTSVNALDSGAVPDGEIYELVLRAYGNDITGVVKDAQGDTVAELSATDAAYASTMVGLGTKGVYSTLFDSVRVRKYVYPEPTIALNVSNTFSISYSPLPNRPFNKINTIWSNINLPLYSDADCITEDTSLGTLVSDTENIIDKYIYNPTSVNLSVNVQTYHMVDAVETYHLESEVVLSWDDGATWNNPAQHVLTPYEKHNLKIKVINPSTSDTVYFEKAIAGVM